MDFSANDIFEKAKVQLSKLDVTYEQNRVSIRRAGVLQCFISRALEIKTKRKVLSAHMVVYPNKFCNSKKLQFWDHNNFDKDDTMLQTIFNDLQTFIKLYDVWMSGERV